MAQGLARTLDRLGQRISRHRPDPLTSVALTVPVFVLYHLGILLLDKRNGVDWLSELTLQLLDRSVLGYVAVTLGLGAALLTSMWLLRSRGRLRPVALVPILVESVLWALAMLASVGWATARMEAALVSGLAADLATSLTPLEKLVMAAGAGFHEELMFRVLLVSGVARLSMRVGSVSALRAFTLSVLISALAFAAVHHLGPLGEPLSLEALIFRSLAGVFLALLYLARGFAVAVYTHTIYDLMVFFVLR
ncbi:MAG: CPBP family glutamic-type intramembrane protease [Myxococcales bacterium]|nr:CPBP family glutamic-type intramembrane protease [Myxococcales bacterium]